MIAGKMEQIHCAMLGGVDSVWSFWTYEKRAENIASNPRRTKIRTILFKNTCPNPRRKIKNPQISHPSFPLLLRFWACVQKLSD